MRSKKTSSAASHPPGFPWNWTREQRAAWRATLAPEINRLAEALREVLVDASEKFNRDRPNPNPTVLEAFADCQIEVLALLNLLAHAASIRRQCILMAEAGRIEDGSWRREWTDAERDAEWQERCELIRLLAETLTRWDTRRGRAH